MTESIPPPRRIAINTFIIGFFAIAAVHVLPRGSLQSQLEQYTNPLSKLLMIDHHFAVFAPTMRADNRRMEALITFEDGSVRAYDFYRFENLDAFSQWQHGKMRGCLVEKLTNDELMKPFYPDVSRYLACANRFPGNQPVKITLAINSSKIAPMNQFVRMDEVPQKFNHQTVFIYNVRPEDVR
ncbi:MAG: hypothetical protein ACRD3W_18170 [Terriglobales bacterium]